MSKKFKFENARSIFSNMTYLPPVLLAVATLFAGVTIFNIKGAIIETKQNLANVASVPKTRFELTKTTVSGARLDEIQQVIATTNPGIEVFVAPNKESITIASNNIGNYKSWLSALQSVQSYGKDGVYWEATDLCMSTSGRCGSYSLMANVQGTAQKITDRNKGGVEPTNKQEDKSAAKAPRTKQQEASK